MIRVVLVVALSVALLGVALPAIDDARTDRTATRLDATAERLDRAATDLVAREDPVRSDAAGARRIVSVRFRARSPSDAGVDYLSIGGTPDGSGGRDALVYRVRGSTARTVDLGVDLRTPEGPVVFRDAGRHRAALGLIRDDGGLGVVVRRD